MNENELNGMEGMEEDVIVFEDEDGQEYEFSVVDYFFYNGEEYALLSEADDIEDKDEIGSIICRVESDDDEEDTFVPVEDEELAEKLFRIATTKLEEDSEEEE